MTDGIILVDKPSNMTSFGVVSRVRRVLTVQNGKKTKVGHTGTLDPFATGLMILTVGKECKNSNHYIKLDKIYQATIKLGYTSTTGDPEGEIMKISNKQPAEMEIAKVLKSFEGKIEQIPPIYSAIKVNGERAYKLARKGEQIKMPIRKVEIYKLRLIKYNYPNLVVEAHVSSGTYIRTLAEDIGTKLKTGAYCTELRRISINKWKVENSITLDEILAQV